MINSSLVVCRIMTLEKWDKDRFLNENGIYDSVTIKYFKKR